MVGTEHLSGYLRSNGAGNKKLKQRWVWTSRQKYCLETCLPLQQHGSIQPRDCASCDYCMPELFPVNQEAWELFQTCATQWRYGLSGRLGLDYSAVYLVAKSLKIKMRKPLLQKIQLLEIWALQGQRDG